MSILFFKLTQFSEINQLKKTTNLDAGIKEVVKLMERAVGAWAKAPLKESTDFPVCHSLNILVGVAEVIEGGSGVSAGLMAGVEAVEAANKRLQDQEKGSGEVREAKLNQARADLHRCMREFLEEYDEESVKDELSRVSSQLSTMSPRIPGPWKLLSIKASAVTRSILLEVATNVRSWLEDSATREATMEANS